MLENQVRVVVTTLKRAVRPDVDSTMKTMMKMMSGMARQVGTVRPIMASTAVGCITNSR